MTKTNPEIVESLKAEFEKNKRLKPDSIELFHTLNPEEQQEIKTYALGVIDNGNKISLETQFNRIYKTLSKIEQQKLDKDGSLLDKFDADEDFKMNEVIVKAIQDESMNKESADFLRVKLLQKNANLLGRVIQRYSRVETNKVSNEDLMQECEIAFLRAIDTYNPDRGVKFSTYAMTLMYNALSGIFKNKINRLLTSETSLNSTIGNTTEPDEKELIDYISDDQHTPEEISEIDSTNKTLYEAINKLQPDRKFVAYVRYELAGVKKYSQFEIANFTGATQTNIAKIETAMKKDLESLLTCAGVDSTVVA